MMASRTFSYLGQHWEIVRGIVAREIVTFQVTIIFELGFMSFCDSHFEFCWVIFIMLD